MDRKKVFGRRVVFELIGSGLEVEEIFYLKIDSSAELRDLLALAEESRIRLVPASRGELDRIAGGTKHQGIIAFYLGVEEVDYKDLLDRRDTAVPHPLVLLDGIEDPRNLGAIIRSAEVFGALGVVGRLRRAAALSPVAIKASAGAALRLPIALVSNIERSIRLAQDTGWWIYGLDPEGETDIWDTDITGDSAFVFGAEGTGLSRLVKERCDKLIRIPQTGEIGSLNVSVSVGVTLAEWSRQMRCRS